MPTPETRFAVLLFTDIVGSTELKSRHGVPAYSEALRVHNDHFERLARKCRGLRILQNLGDGYFAEAGSVTEAVRFALLFQHAIRQEPWGEVPLTTRVGIHAGEVGTFDSEGGSGLVSPAADVASRIANLATGGQILLSRFPFDEARHFIREHPAADGENEPPSLRWLAHGPYLLKGSPEPVEIFEVGADGAAPLTPPPDTEKARRAVRPGEEETLGWRPAVGLEIPGRPGWHLTERLGAGSFGEVWSGEHAKFGQRRAFKFCFDDERLRALKREVTLIRLMRTTLGERDDIVRLHELKLDEPPFYLESDLAPHGNLLQWAERQGGLDKLPLQQRIELVAHTAAALAAAHSVGVLHKDIKPTNILIFDGPDGEPRPRLVDFGIGTLSDSSLLGQHGITRAGFTRPTLDHSTGTPTYCPPEYLAGRPYTIPGDIYGLGVLLYQLVTAKPFDPIAPGWERDIADPLLREDIAACVDGDPARRLPSAVELAERLLSLDRRRAEIEARENRKREEAARTQALVNRVARLKLSIPCMGIVVAAGYFAVSGGRVSLFDNLSYDLPFIAHRAGGADDLRIVHLDQMDGDRLDRRVQAKLLDELNQAGALAVVYDVIFDEPSTDPAVDQAFAAAIRRFRGVDEEGAPDPAAPRRPVLLAGGRELIGQAGAFGERLIPPTDDLLDAADDYGLVPFIHDKNFTVRELATGSPDEPSLAWKVALAAGTKLDEAERLSPRWINYAGPPCDPADPHATPAIRSCTASNVLAGTDPGFFRNKIVVVGSKPGIVGKAAGMDLFSTPFHRFHHCGDLPLMGGVEVQAHMIANLLHGNWLVRTSEKFNFGLFHSVGVLASLAFSWLRPKSAVFMALAGTLVLTLAGFLSMYFFGVWFPWSVPALVQIPSALACGVFACFWSERLSSRSRSAARQVQREQPDLVRPGLALHLSPNSIQRLLSEDMRLRCRGQNAAVAIMVAGIPTYLRSSKCARSPEQLIGDLKAYLQHTTRQILGHDGMVVRFIGDSILAAWGTPLVDPFPDADAAAKALRAAWQVVANDGPFVEGDNTNTRIALHFCEVIAGNTGDGGCMNYEMLGDTVGLAACIQELNVILSTRILMSDAMSQQIRREFHTRRIGRFRFNNRGEIVEIHELLGSARSGSEPQWITDFDQGLSALEANDLAAAVALFRLADARRSDSRGDGPSRFFLTLLESGSTPANGIVDLWERQPNPLPPDLRAAQ